MSRGDRNATNATTANATSLEPTLVTSSAADSRPERSGTETSRPTDPTSWPKGGLLFATGGSGGHIYPAVAIARELGSRGHVVAFLGAIDGMEARIVPAEGFVFFGVAAGKWDRGRPDPRQGLRAAQGLGQAVALLRATAPALVVGFGGFASFPGLAAARLLGVPYVLHEANALPGRVVRLFARGAQVVAVSSEAARARLRGARRLEVSGFPVREARLPRAEARDRLGLPREGVLTLVMGGSQGSRVLNEAAPAAYAELARRPLVLHSTGPRWLEAMRARTSALEPEYQVRAYLESSLAWSAADLALTRAGFGTLAEAAFHGVPAIMVPLPSAAENHQLHNARAVAAAGAGWLVDEHALAGLAGVWARALEPELRARASAAARALSPAGAAARLADLVEDVLPRARATGLGRRAS